MNLSADITPPDKGYLYLSWYDEKFHTMSEKIIADKEQYYTHFRIPKKNGKFRIIDAPTHELKVLQKTLLKYFLNNYSPYSIAHGFVEHRSPKTNAECHIKAKIIVVLDIKDFFPSIKIDRVKRVLEYLIPKKWKRLGCHEVTRQKFIDILSELLTYNGCLPQGSPASPALSNLAVLGMDKVLKKLELLNGCVVTRYADDITLSSDYNTTLAQIIPKVTGIINKFGFRVNTKKTRVVKTNKRMMVTGIVVNTKLNVRKDKRRQLRARLHNLIRDKKTIDQHTYSELRGQIEWIKSLNEIHGKTLLNSLKQISIERKGEFLDCTSVPILPLQELYPIRKTPGLRKKITKRDATLLNGIEPIQL